MNHIHIDSIMYYYMPIICLFNVDFSFPCYEAIKPLCQTCHQRVLWNSWRLLLQDTKALAAGSGFPTSHDIP